MNDTSSAALSERLNESKAKVPLAPEEVPRTASPSLSRMVAPTTGLPEASATLPEILRGGGNLRTAARRQDHLVPLDVYENVGNTFQHDPFDGPGLRSDGNDTGQVDVGVVIRERVLPLRLDLPQQFGDSDIFQMDRHGRVGGGNTPDGHKQKNE